ncbi:hypothetical protein PF010_g28385 [Phytophthora fragariae]|uniref:DDE Tnp4 domain-containing protein n=2 Tax=Phytophthora fragariae TaxID=53985 RepID=A0A6G0JR90_9STRA|nr:hypothetical protein PF010_g28385 [Phytophthora fragariae]
MLWGGNEGCSASEDGGEDGVDSDVDMDVTEEAQGAIDETQGLVEGVASDLVEVDDIDPPLMLMDDYGDEDLLLLCFLLVTVVVVLSQLDGRSVRRPPGEVVVVRSDFFPRLKANRSLKAYRRTYTFDYGLAVLLTYYGNGCGQDGDGIGGAANQLGMSRTAALRYIQKLEELLYGMMDDVVYFPAPTADEEWDDLVEGFSARGGDFPDVACIFDGTIVRTRRPNEHLVRYILSYCVYWFAIDYRNKFRYIGVFSGSNSDQSMWNQSEVLGARARHICPPGINWLGDSGFKIWPFLMVPYDERRGKRLTRKQRCYNYHLSSTRILVECVFGKLKARFKVTHGVTDRRSHQTNARMICVTVVLHNLLVDIGDKEEFDIARNDEERKQARGVMNAYNQYWDRTKSEVQLAESKRDSYANYFYQNDNE